MWFRNNDKNDLLEHRVAQLEKEVANLHQRFAIKLVQTIVFALCGAILMGVVTAAIGGVPWLGS